MINFRYILALATLLYLSFDGFSQNDSLMVERERFVSNCDDDPQYRALKIFYNELKGDDWKNNSGWGEDCDYCQWFGIQCDNERNVTQLFLPDNNLSGVLPASLGSLSELRILLLDQNEISGRLPNELYNLTNLGFLILNNNRIEGELNPAIGSMTNIRWLLLNENNFSGQIPNELGRLSEALIINLNNNQFDGTIPPELSSLNSFLFLDLSFNLLEGCIPETFRNLCGKAVVLRDNPCLSHNADFATFCISEECLPSNDTQCATCDDGIKNQGEEKVDCGGPCESCPPCDNNAEYNALMTIYNEMGGANWNINTGWTEGCDICDWYGVECDSMKRVTGLLLPFNNLKNQIPEEIGNLTFLQSLILDQNEINGSLPESLFTLTSLEYVSLGHNEIGGELSVQIGNLTQLKWLLLSDNSLEGHLPQELGDMSFLSQLLLSNNELEGEIPSSLSELVEIRSLHLSNNNLSGCIPGSLRLLCGKDVDLSDNHCLSHDASFRSFCAGDPCFPILKVGCGTCEDGILNQDESGIDCGGSVCAPCTVCDSFPDYEPLMALFESTRGESWLNNKGWGEDCNYCEWYGIECDSSNRVKNLLLPLNGLNGPLPLEITKLSKISAIILDQNQLSGTLPEEIGILDELTFLSLSRNNIEGEIPHSIGKLDNLNWLLLNANKLSGEIPSSLSDLSSISQLLLSDNKLSGKIPDSLAYLPNVNNLHLNDNQLSGCIPESFNVLCGTDVNLFNNICLSHDGDFSKFCSTDQACELPMIVGCGSCEDGIRNQDEEGVDCGGSCDNQCSDCPDVPDYEALMAIYIATGGDNWITNTNWGDTCDVCTWYGIQCNEEGRVVNLFLPQNNLKGTLPLGIGSLTYLEALVIDGNDLTGDFPSSIGSLPSIEYILANNNQFSGNIPEELGNLEQLKWLLLGNNNLEGELPTSLGNLINIDQLILGNNKLHGSIPQELALLENINSLHLNDNQLSGCIPESFRTLCGKNINLINNECLSHKGEFSSFCISGGCEPSTSDECGTCDDGVKNNNETGIDCGGLCEKLCDDCPDSPDYLALMSFYNATNGKDWLINTGWNDTCDVCTWYGVECDSTQRVTRLFLPFNGLSGEIPNEISELEYLEDLLIDFNEISGEIPESLGDLSRLELLILSNNELEGSLPNSIGNLSQLQWLLLNGNNLIGTIPDTLGQLENLNRLILSENNLSGEIPSSLGDLENLDFLMLHTNQLFGCIPPSLITHCDAQVRLDNNGCLSHNGDFELFCSDTSCDEIEVCECIEPNDERDILMTMFDSLNGPNWTSHEGWNTDCDHCSWYGISCNENNKVEKIELKSNNLSGKISFQISGLSSLTFLDMSDNDIHGEVPEDIGHLSELQFLRLSDNRFSGSIPQSLGDIHNLWDLRLHNNQLTDTIPSQLGQLKNLFNLFLSNNQLSGEIPAEIGGLKTLFQLKLNDNDLSGCIPESFHNLCATRVDLSNNRCLSHGASIERFCRDEECDLGTLENCGENEIESELDSLNNDDEISDVFIDKFDLGKSVSPKVSIYPNPATDYIIIALDKDTEPIKGSIIDLQGRKVIDIKIEAKTLVDINTLKDGFYIFQYLTKDGTITEKFVKSRLR